MKKFEKTFFASWTDLDPNWHVANHAYIKYAADTRVSFFSAIRKNPALYLRGFFYTKLTIRGKKST